MEKLIKTPEFKDESEEARWWAEHQSAVLSEFKRAANDGSLGRGTLARRGDTPGVTIRLDPADIELARKQAEKRGLRYQTYIKMVLHQALAKEADAVSSPS